MKREFKVEANIGAPQVLSKLYLDHQMDRYINIKQPIGGAGQFAKVTLSVEPLTLDK